MVSIGRHFVVGVLLLLGLFHLWQYDNISEVFQVPGLANLFVHDETVFEYHFDDVLFFVELNLDKPGSVLHSKE